MTRAYQGRGSRLLFSTDAINYLQLGQLQTITPSGSRSQIVDVTHMGSGPFSQKQSVQVDGGDISFTGVLDPQDPVLQIFSKLQPNFTQCWFRVILTDGTALYFQGFVSEFVSFKIDYSKALSFSGKISVTGGIQTGPGGFQVPGFQSPGFQTFFA